MAAEAGGDDQIHLRLGRLLVRHDRHPGIGKQLCRAGRERRGARTGHQKLDAPVVVEQGEHIEQPGRGGHVVHDDEHAQALAPGRPPRRIVPHRHPHPPGQPVRHPSARPFIGFLRGYSALQGGEETDSCGAG
ncbi:hypothetical protein [Streptomyces sp. NBC_01618]|uniref:hypothetical protein n=1 Tax=Streptomyces sp. NBC_01618 TaxID=2975900 RepID=UPI00386F4654|nr:hypothetical protein OH735_32660 [Streptomyces sp. NBC_01618]